MEALNSEAPRAAKYPIDTSAPLHPTRVLYLQDSTASSFNLADITSATLGAVKLGDAHTSQPTSVFVTAKEASSTAPSALHFRRTKSGLFSASHLIVTAGSSDTQVAELSSSGVLSFGRWTVSFPPDSTHCSHDLKLQPVGLWSSVDWFVQDSVPYFWDMADVNGAGGQGVCRLFKVADGKRVEVGRFLAQRMRDKGGVLVLDGQAVDEVVACATLVATINRVESFRA